MSVKSLLLSGVTGLGGQKETGGVASTFIV